MAKTAAMSARHTGARINMGTAGRDRRFRVFPQAKAATRMSKKHQPGARAEDEAEAMLVSTSPPTSIVPIRNDKFVKAKGKAKAKATLQQYTRDRSPHQRRGRTAALSRSSLKE